jgi:hypothetical protein
LLDLWPDCSSLVLLFSPPCKPSSSFRCSQSVFLAVPCVPVLSKCNIRSGMCRQHFTFLVYIPAQYCTCYVSLNTSDGGKLHKTNVCMADLCSAVQKLCGWTAFISLLQIFRINRLLEFCWLRSLY